MKKLAVVCVLVVSSCLAIIPLLDSYSIINNTINSVQVIISGESMVEYIDEGLTEMLNVDELNELARLSD
jgi:hypothetical protein